jgi:hypothetical protein
LRLPWLVPLLLVTLSFAWVTPLSDFPLPFPFVPFPLTWGFKTYLRHQKIKKIKALKKY